MTKRLFDSAEDVAQMSERNRASRVKKAAAQLPASSVDGKCTSAVSAAPIRKRKKFTDYNAMLQYQLRESGIDGWCPEYMFDAERNWRIDFALPGKIAFEIDGMAHRVKEVWLASFEREQALFFSGWRLLKVSTKQVRSREAVQLIERALSMLI